MLDLIIVVDVVSYVSCDRVGFLDPHENHFEDRNRRPLATYTWYLQKDQFREKTSELTDQWLPFCHDVFGINLDTFISGRFAVT